MSEIKEFFDGLFSEEEKEDVRKWIKDERPKLPQMVKINGNEYNIMVIFEDGELTAFKAMK